jgi:hypothetical protein
LDQTDSAQISLITVSCIGVDVIKWPRLAKMADGRARICIKKGSKPKVVLPAFDKKEGYADLGFGKLSGAISLTLRFPS